MTDTNCQRASQSLYETIAVSLFARLRPRALLAASPLARDSCSATFCPRVFEQKRDCSHSQSSVGMKGNYLHYSHRISFVQDNINTNHTFVVNEILNLYDISRDFLADASPSRSSYS